MRVFGIMMLLAFGITVASIASADDAAKSESTQTSASKSRDPASTGGEMSRDSEEALKGAVSRVNQLMDTASKSAPTEAPEQTAE